MNPPYYAELLVGNGEFSYWFCWWSLAAIAVWVRMLLKDGISWSARSLAERWGMPVAVSPVSQCGRFPTGFG